jgi:YVTN family beta-propeller protein
MATQPRRRVFLVGRVAIESDGAVIDDARFPGRQGRLLFAYLVAEQGRPVPRDELADAIWGEAPPPSWDKALTGVVSKLRTLLANGGSNGAGTLTGAFGCYRLDMPDGTWVDVIAAAEAAAEAEDALAAGDAQKARLAAQQAASLTRQTFLPGEDGAWVEEKRRELAEIRLRALSTLADACLRSGDGDEATSWAEQAVRLAPFRESGYRRLMEAHIAAGNRAEALQTYEGCRKLLAEELGAYPSPEIESVYRRLLERPAVEEALAAPRSEPTAPPIVETAFPQIATHVRAVTRRRAAAAAAIIACAAAAGVAFVVTRGGSSPALAATNSVGFIGASGGHLARVAEVGQAPTSVAVGAGSVWTTDGASNTVSQIDPRSRSVRQTIGVGASPDGIAVGGGGVWVADHDDDTVSWINPQTSAVVRTIHVGAGPTAVAYGYGSVWVTNSDDRTVTRIDADTGKVTRTIRANASGRGITVGGGSVWVTDEATGNVRGIDPKTNLVTLTATAGSDPTGIAYGAGSLWVADALDDTITRLDATTLGRERTIPVPGGPSSVAFTGGAVWVTSEYGSRVVRIDPRRDSIVGSTPTGNRPQGLAVGDDGVWIAARASGDGHRGGRLLVLGGGLDSIDPAIADNTDSVPLLGNAYDGLTALRRTGGAAGTQLLPDLAVALPRPTESGTSYTFRLRPGIRYSDGRPLRAVDFRRALMRDLELNSPWASPFAHIAGADACIRYRRCDLSRSVVVEGRSTLTFRLPAADPRLFWELAKLAPIPAGMPVRDVGTTPIPSTGPYAIESYRPGRLLSFVRNPYFHVWSAAARPDGYPDEIAYRMVSNESAAIRDVLAGRADLLYEGDLSGDIVQRLSAHHPLQLHLDAQQATAYIFLNVRRPPFDDIRVRRALNYAVDRAKVVALHGAGLGQPTCQLVPPTDPGYRAYCPYTAAPDAGGEWKAPDLAKARALIRASGTRGQTVVVWSFSYFQRESQYFVALLRRLGYRARLHYVWDIDAYFAALVRTPTAQAGFDGNFGVPLAADMLDEAGCHSADADSTHFCDRRIDAQLARLDKSGPGPASTAALAARIDREVTDEAPYIPLFTPRLPDLTSRRVGDYEQHGGFVLLDQLWVR